MFFFYFIFFYCQHKCLYVEKKKCLPITVPGIQQYFNKLGVRCTHMGLSSTNSKLHQFIRKIDISFCIKEEGKKMTIEWPFFQHFLLLSLTHGICVFWIQTSIVLISYSFTFSETAVARCGPIIGWTRLCQVNRSDV